ncbi:MAG TPA: adenylate/guanylate cyclase domain-containing protein [Acidimicrobiales bacterium]|nr:adenylate/guanylate cyclase domain-containing protein [Acidimicrobiales bacterium]
MERSTELVEVMKRLYAAARRGDAETIRAMFSDEVGFYFWGTDPDEGWASPDAVAALWRMNWVEMGETFPMFEGERIQAWCDGNVGWVIDEPRLEPPFPDGLLIRITAVFRLERGIWKVVHAHVSVAVANEEALGIELTTSLEALADAVAVERPDVSPSTALDGTITIMFTDICDSTALTHSVGDQAWIEVLRHHRDLVTKQVGAWGGQVVKSIGDGFMLAFPSARSAVRCGMAIQSDVAAVVLPGGEALSIRVGLHAGEPVRDGEDFYGTTVNMAARVASAAGAGEVLVSDLVRALVSSDAGIEMGHARNVELKGLPGQHDLTPVVAA